MKHITPILLLAASAASANTANLHFLRQHQQTTKVVWDMPVALKGQSPSALEIENNGALFQLWAVIPAQSRDYLLDQKLVGAYLPKADIKVVTLDPNGSVPRTRVDQPFRVEIQVSNLLTGTGLPLASSAVLLEQHVGHHTASKSPLDPVVVTSQSPLASGYLSANGQHVMSYPVSRVPAPDPTKASGEEHFVVHALADGNVAQTQIASAKVQVWPVASGVIKGVKHGETFRFQAPQIELILNDLYPCSDTYLMLYKGTQINGAIGRAVKDFPVDRDTTESAVLSIKNLDNFLEEDGTYTLALMSDTVYGRELLCDPVSFAVQRTIHVNAMQVGYSDISKP
jgi:hypothetical protein